MITLKFYFNTQYQIEIINHLANDIDSMYPTDWCEVYIVNNYNGSKLKFAETTLLDVLMKIGFTVDGILDGRNDLLDILKPFSLGETYNSLSQNLLSRSQNISDTDNRLMDLSNKFSLLIGQCYQSWLYRSCENIYFELVENIDLYGSSTYFNEGEMINSDLPVFSPIFTEITRDYLLMMMCTFNYYHMQLYPKDTKLPMFPEYGVCKPI